jgi:hypothetical protein
LILSLRKERALTNRWSVEDEEKLKHLWVGACKEDIMGTFPQRNWKNILTKAKLLNLPSRLRERLIPVNQKFFAKWSPTMAYVFGFWFADGWMTQPNTDALICFVSKDEEHLELIRDAMQSQHTIHPQGTGCLRLSIGSKRLWHELYRLGGVPAKSLIAEMPFVPKDYVRHFIRGYVDGDGTIRWEAPAHRRPILSMVGGSKFLSQVATLLDEEAGVGIARVQSYDYKTPEIVYKGIKAKTLAKWLYSNADLALERKAVVAHEFANWEISKFGWKSQAVMTAKMQAILQDTDIGNGA